ncbi:carbohydrate ABC transporter permease [Cohnella sp. GbtcB17]|uniref:carbohydrate ABC transporter permease n=1 Tax=Cohnella sp. GbtcB17 TaxID=2824762 RepID=UPI001C2FBC6C|nr:carbohydrate ABC transporter permease [Cohnella sp. GbtcB17]
MLLLAARKWKGGWSGGILYAILLVSSLLCLFPLVHVVAVSFSSSHAAASGSVVLWPEEATLSSYRFVFRQRQFLEAAWISAQRVALATAVGFVLTGLAAYPLSREPREFAGRTLYAWYFAFVLFFGGGLIPLYMTVKDTHLLDTIWALVIPGAVPVFNVLLLLNFFRGLPRGLEESAKLDGAGHFKVLLRIYLPLSLPALATTTLFTMVAHWNNWFDGLIYMNAKDNYPLQTLLQTIVIAKDAQFSSIQDAAAMALISDRTVHSAQIVVAAFPILLVYPFLQRFFIKGIVLGSVKE